LPQRHLPIVVLCGRNVAKKIFAWDRG
jgi:hypothetical protein